MFMVILLLLPLVICGNPFATEIIAVHHSTHQCVPCLYTHLHIDILDKSVPGHLPVVKMILLSSRIGLIDPYRNILKQTCTLCTTHLLMLLWLPDYLCSAQEAPSFFPGSSLGARDPIGGWQNYSLPFLFLIDPVFVSTTVCFITHSGYMSVLLFCM